MPKTLASLTAVPGWNYVADGAEPNALHMAVTATPDRNPSFVLFTKPNVYYGYKGSTECIRRYLWHGDVAVVQNVLDAAVSASDNAGNRHYLLPEAMCNSLTPRSHRGVLVTYMDSSHRSKIDGYLIRV